MRKLRTDSIWSQLKPDQRKTLESWLFDEHVSYAEILQRVEKEFGLKSNTASLSRYRTRRAAEREMIAVVEAHARGGQFNNLVVTPEKLRAAASLMLGKHIIDANCYEPENAQKFGYLYRLLLEDSDARVRETRMRLAQKEYQLQVARLAQQLADPQPETKNSEELVA